MLSPGELWKRVPKTRDANLKFRRGLICGVIGKPAEQAALRKICAQDILFYVNTFAWTFDPRTKDKSLPFMTYSFQDRALLEILECIELGRDLVIEKSRDMGASWMSLTVMEWLWHFHPGHSFLMVSRKEDLVDAPGDPDSLFWKVDFIHRHLPTWLRPRTDRRKLHFGNLDNGSTIDGESTTAAAGVGGRRTAMFIDEFSRIEEGYQLLAGTADTTRCRIFNFTPFGTNNAAYKLARRGDVRKLRLHWREHPEKARGLYQFDTAKKFVNVIDDIGQAERDRIWNDTGREGHHKFVEDGRLRSPWYDSECIRRDNEREVAQMLDIDYQGSAYQFFERQTIMALQAEFCIPPIWEGEVSYDAYNGRFIELTRVSGGPLKLWTIPTVENRPVAAEYSVGADLSWGVGATNSCLSIVHNTTGERVGEYISPFIKPEAMAVIAVALCWAFQSIEGYGAKLIWEKQGPGTPFGQKIMALNYRFVFHQTNEQSYAKKSTDNPGWSPTPDNKRNEFAAYRSALSTRRFINRSHAALEECLHYIHTAQGTIEHGGDGNDDPTGARVNHGDRVVADVLAYKLAAGSIDVVKERKPIPPPQTPLALAGRRLIAERARQAEEVWV
jgi:hypothetical protein